MTTKAVPGRYTMQITATVYANNRREAYRLTERAIDSRELSFVDAEDTKIEPYCVHVDAGQSYEDERDLAVAGSALCAICQKADRLTKGLIYDVTAMRDAVIGWTGVHVGYNVGDYFDGDGRYLGADAEGIEPLFADFRG